MQTYFGLILNTTNAQLDLTNLLSQGDPRHRNAKLIEPPNDSYRIAVDLCKIFNVSMHCCIDLGDVGVTDFDAVFVGTPENQSQHPIWIAGHEVWHMLQRRHIILIGDFESVEMSNILPDAINNRRNIQDNVVGQYFHQLLGKKLTSKVTPENEIIKEIFSDVFGNVWCDKEFWHGIRGAHGGIFDDTIDGAIVFLNNNSPLFYREWYKDRHTFTKKLIPLTIELINP